LIWNFWWIIPLLWNEWFFHKWPFYIHKKQVSDRSALIATSGKA